MISVRTVAVYFNLIVVIVSCNRNQTHSKQLNEKHDKVFYDTTSQLTIVYDELWATSVIDNKGNVLLKFPLRLSHLLPDGNIVGCRGHHLVKTNFEGKVIWEKDIGKEIHHQITSDSSGLIYLLCSDVHSFMGLKVRFDRIEVYNQNGNLIYNWCVFDHLKEFVTVISQSVWTKYLPKDFKNCNSIEDYILQDPEQFIFPTDFDCNCNFEFTHFSSIQILPPNNLSAKINAFKPGNLLLNFSPYACYGVLDMATSKISWAGYLPQRTTLHTPTLTPQNTILVFRNCTDATSWKKRGGNELLISRFVATPPDNSFKNLPASEISTSISEYDATTNKLIWEYKTEPGGKMCAYYRGSAQRTDNYHTLICMTTDSTGGQVFELDSTGKKIWQYNNPQLDDVLHLPAPLSRAQRLNREESEKILKFLNK